MFYKAHLSREINTMWLIEPRTECSHARVVGHSSLRNEGNMAGINFFYDNRNWKMDHIYQIENLHYTPLHFNNTRVRVIDIFLALEIGFCF